MLTWPRALNSPELTEYSVTGGNDERNIPRLSVMEELSVTVSLVCGGRGTDLVASILLFSDTKMAARVNSLRRCMVAGTAMSYSEAINREANLRGKPWGFHLDTSSCLSPPFPHILVRPFTLLTCNSYEEMSRNNSNAKAHCLFFFVKRWRFSVILYCPNNDS